MDPETIFHDTAKVQERCKRSEKTHLHCLLLCELTRSEKTHANSSPRTCDNIQTVRKDTFELSRRHDTAHDHKRHMPLSCKGWKHPSLTSAAAKKTPLEAAKSCDQKRHTPPRLHFCYTAKKKIIFTWGFIVHVLGCSPSPLHPVTPSTPRLSGLAPPLRIIATTVSNRLPARARNIPR